MSISEAAWDLIPGRRERQRMLKAVDLPVGWRPGQPVVKLRSTVLAVEAEVRGQVERLLLAGEPVPEDIAAPILEAQMQLEADKTRARIIADVLGSSSAADVIDEHSIEPPLEYLRGELARVVGRAQELAPIVRGIDSPSAALDGTPEQVDAWRELRDLAAQHDEIRATHFSMLQAAVKGSLDYTLTRREFEKHALYANAFDVQPDLISDRVAAARVPHENTPTVDAWAEWMYTGHDETPAEAPNIEPARKIALIATTTTPWIPGLEQFENARLRTGIMLTRPTYTGLRQMLEARAGYYRDNDVTPHTALGGALESEEAQAATSLTLQQRRTQAQRRVRDRILL